MENIIQNNCSNMENIIQNNCSNLESIIQNNCSNLQSSIQQQICEQLARREFARLAADTADIGISTEKYFENELVVSLTSHGKRIYDVYLTIESIMRQTILPNKIILWLSKDEFDPSELPVSLKRQRERGLAIEFCEDIKSYTKLIPTLRKYPDAAVITVDDDLLYQFDMVENLISAYKKNSQYICFCRGRRMKPDKSGGLCSYNEWELCNIDIPDYMNFPTGIGGVLYPPRCLGDEVFNQDVFMKLCPTADDVWFKAMSLLQGTLSKKVATRNSYGIDFIDLLGPAQTESALWSWSINRKKNDEQIKSVFEKYDLYKRLINKKEPSEDKISPEES